MDPQISGFSIVCNSFSISSYHVSIVICNHLKIGGQVVNSSLVSSAKILQGDVAMGFQGL